MEDVCDKLEKNRKNYEQSELGKAKNKRWNDSEAGKAARERYLSSEKGQAAILRWQLSEKAITARQKRKSLVRLFNLTRKYFLIHPDATMEEALEEITKEAQ